jgi:CHAT domain-containing protein
VGLAEGRNAGPVRLYLGGQASRQEVLTGAVSSSRLVHFGTHVELNPAYPEFSALHLSEIDPNGQPIDGALRLQDLGRLDLSAQVVTLAGCNTAIGTSLGTEGPMAFPRGFLFAGADTVVASLWRVRDEPTAQLMIRFYRGLLIDELAVAEALRQAQLSLLDGDWPELEHWAGFVLLGEWENTPNTDRNQPFPGSGVYPR